MEMREVATAVKSSELLRLAPKNIPSCLDPIPAEFLEPLVFHWDEDEFVASEAVREFSAAMYADH